MAKSVLLTTILIVVSSSVNSERRSFLSYSKNFQKAVPHFWKHDQEELNRNLDKNTRQSRGEMRVGPHPPPLRPNPPASWILGTHQVEKELTQNRVNELKNKLIPNNIAHVRAFNQPNPKPKFKLKNSLENKRHKRDVTQVENDREKREVIINPQIKPEMVMQPHLQPALVQEVENQYQDKIIEKRDKRQILLMINQRPLQPLELAKKPRTTPNPFIRDTNIADYDIVKPESYKPEVEVVNSMDTDSYQLNEEASELSNILSNFYLTTSSENWPEIQQFAEKVLKPLSELLGVKVKEKYSFHGTPTDTVDKYTATSETKVNRRVKRKLDKTLIRKRAKKRKQKQRRVERKRLRMLTHARRLRKQRKSKLARLQRHYARMNLTITAIPSQVSGLNTTKKEKERVRGEIEKGVATISKSESYERLGSESEASYYDSDDESEEEYDSSDEDENESDLELDDGNDDEYEEYEDESSTNSFEYVDYENVEDESNKSKKKLGKESNKKQASAKETGKKANKKNENNKKGKKA